MKKVSIFWNRDSNDLSRLIVDELQNDSRVELIPAEQQGGSGEEVYTSDVSWLSNLAVRFNCSIE